MSRKLRIGIDVGSTTGRSTGIGRYTANLLSAMRRLAPEHDFVEIGVNRDLDLRTDRRIYWEQVGLARAAVGRRLNLLHLPGFAAPLVRPVPVVITVHDLIGRLFPANLPPISRFYWSRYLPFSLRFADALIAVSERTRDDVVKLLGIPPERIDVVPEAAEPRFRPVGDPEELAAVRRKLRLPERFLLYAGTIEPRKGLVDLVQAYHRLRQRPVSLPALVIAGKKGWYQEGLFRLVAELELQVVFTDYVAEDDLPALYSLAELFIFPSHYEGFGLPVLEAMACGTPVITTTGGALPEVAGSAALTVPPGNPDALAGQIERVLGSQALRAGLRQRGLAQAASFSWDRAAEATLAVYARIAARLPES